MKRIFLWAILAGVVLIIGFFAWRVTHFYKAIKNGEVINLQTKGFSTAKNASGNNNIGEAVNVESAKSPRLGNAEAKIKIVEFIDFTCLSSKEAFSIMRELLTKYPDKIEWSTRFFPLGDDAHSGGREAAAAALCSQAQGKFWEYHDKLFLNQTNFTGDDLIGFAKQIGLDQVKFNACMYSKIISDWIDEDLKAGIVSGVQGTPTFFINGQKLEGYLTLDSWEKVLQFK